jgi:hypothetical protein
MTPDAEDYIRSRLSSMTPDAEPVIVRETRLGEPLDGSGKKIHWWYEGENFLIAYFPPGAKPQTEQVELLGRSVSITPEALRQLAGQTLTLRRVNPTYGLLNAPQYVLLAESAPEVSFKTNDRTKNNVSIAALTVLGGFSGMGIIWIVICILIPLLKIPENKFLPLIFPSFIAGWIVSAVVSFFFFRSVFKAKGRTKFVQEQMQRKYVGYGGLSSQLNWWIFVGIPMPLIIALVLVLEQFARTVGQKTAVVFVAIVMVGVPVMYFSDRIPRRMIIRLGLLGWALTIIGGFWYFKTHGP